LRRRSIQSASHSSSRFSVNRALTVSSYLLPHATAARIAIQEDGALAGDKPDEVRLGHGGGLLGR
jgi:hypothetical protein